MACRLVNIAGLTLVEMVVTLAILAVLGLVAVPSLVAFHRSAALMSAASQVSAALSTARTQAMARTLPTRVEPFKNGDWSTGWIVYVDQNLNGSYDLGSDLLLLSQQTPLPDFLTTKKTGADGFVFNASGFAMSSMGFSNASLVIRRNDTAAGAETLAQTRKVVVSNTGRIRVCTPRTASDANCDIAGL